MKVWIRPGAVEIGSAYRCPGAATAVRPVDVSGGCLGEREEKHQRGEEACGAERGWTAESIGGRNWAPNVKLRPPISAERPKSQSWGAAAPGPQTQGR